MITFVVVGGPDSRERARDRILSRLCAAAAHSRHAGRNSAVFRCGVFARVRGLPGIASRNTGRQASFNSFPIFRGVGSLIPGLRRALQLLQKPAHALADRLHVFSSLLPDGFDHDRRKRQGVVKE